jgi:hypothetical protein
VGGQDGPALQHRQQLVGDTPAAAAGAAARSGRRLSTGPGAATPAEVRALREEVASLRTQVRRDPEVLQRLSRAGGMHAALLLPCLERVPPTTTYMLSGCWTCCSGSCFWFSCFCTWASFKTLAVCVAAGGVQCAA